MSSATQPNNKPKVQHAGAVPAPANAKATKATPPTAEQGKRKKKQKQKAETATVPPKIVPAADIKPPTAVPVSPKGLLRSSIDFRKGGTGKTYSEKASGSSRATVNTTNTVDFSGRCSTAPSRGTEGPETRFISQPKCE